jgi:hypothetical protein
MNLCAGLYCMTLSMQGFPDYPIEVIELKSRPLDEILPVIQPFAGADGTTWSSRQHRRG